MSSPIALQRPESSRCIILCSCIVDEGTRQPTITRRRQGRHICVLLLSYRQLLHFLTVTFCHAMTSVLLSYLLRNDLSGCDFTVLGPMATGQSARVSQRCYQATCLTLQTNVTENQ